MATIKGPVLLRCPTCGQWIKRRLIGKRGWRHLPRHTKQGWRMNRWGPVADKSGSECMGGESKQKPVTCEGVKR